MKTTKHKTTLRWLFVPLVWLFSTVTMAQTTASDTTNYEVATLAGGCFWCTESDLEQLNGVIDVVSGYSGGSKANPTYSEVSSGKSGHIEVISVTFDSKIVTYEQVLDYFFRHIDPTDDKGSFVDRGPQYRPAIFYHDPTQQKTAREFMQEIDHANIYPKPLKTELIKFEHFWPAEAYHQDYYKRNSLRYKYYRFSSGRDKYLDSVFGKQRKTHPVTLREKINQHKAQHSAAKDEMPSRETSVTLSLSTAQYQKPTAAQIKAQLTPLQYKVTQHEGTERPFDNAYWDNKAEGIYVDIVSGEPLFSSTDKYSSGTGWPSFTKPIDGQFIVTKEDRSLFFSRTEVRSKIADSHLGHMFDDGPQPTGLRYCMNSAAMRFIAKNELRQQGYEQYLDLFE